MGRGAGAGQGLQPGVGVRSKGGVGEAGRRSAGGIYCFATAMSGHMSCPPPPGGHPGPGVCVEAMARTPGRPSGSAGQRCCCAHVCVHVCVHGRACTWVSVALEGAVLALGKKGARFSSSSLLASLGGFFSRNDLSRKRPTAPTGVVVSAGHMEHSKGNSLIFTGRGSQKA